MKLTLTSFLVKPVSPQNVSVSSGALPTGLTLSWQNWIPEAMMKLKFNIRYRIVGDTNWTEVIPLMSLGMILLKSSHPSNCSSLCCTSEHSLSCHCVLHGHPQRFIWLVHGGCNLGIFWHWAWWSSCVFVDFSAVLSVTVQYVYFKFYFAHAM